MGTLVPPGVAGDAFTHITLACAVLGGLVVGDLFGRLG